MNTKLTFSLFLQLYSGCRFYTSCFYSLNTNDVSHQSKNCFIAGSWFYSSFFRFCLNRYYNFWRRFGRRRNSVNDLLPFCGNFDMTIYLVMLPHVTVNNFTIAHYQYNYLLILLLYGGHKVQWQLKEKFPFYFRRENTNLHFSSIEQKRE